MPAILSKKCLRNMSVSISLRFMASNYWSTLGNSNMPIYFANLLNEMETNF